MKVAAAAIAIAVAALATAGSAVASDKVTDVEYMKANRCKGLASTLTGVVDTAALDSFIKSERGARAQYIVERGEELQAKARREARSEDRKEKLTAELTGPCSAYLGGPSSVAKQ